ncbi:MAG: sulfatase [Kiritimatiellales bacterium]|nr:sulfatase [Kiritimatiellales bacterium]
MKKRLHRLSIICCLLAGIGKAETILVDFGASDKTSPTNGPVVWNNVSHARQDGMPSAGLMSLDLGGNLLATNGADTGFTFAATNLNGTAVRVGLADVDLLGITPVSPAGIVYPTSAAEDSMQTAGSDETIQYKVTLGNLDAALRYHFHFFASSRKTNVSGSEWDVADSNGSISVSISAAQVLNNSNSFRSVEWRVPDASREINIVFDSPPGDANLYSRWNTLEIVTTTNMPPPPQVYTNFLVITADDLHKEALGCYGSPVVDISPNVDAFAAGGLRFTHAFVNNAICEPSRKVLASGLYGHNSGAMGFMKVNPDVITVLDRLRDEDYKLGILGKVGHSSPKNINEWDFRHDAGELGGGRAPTRYYDFCTNFFNLCKAENKPFYFMVNSHDPHLPWYDPGNGTTYTNEEVPSRLYGPSEFPVPEHLPDIPGVRDALANFYNSTKRFDDTFGKVMQALDESGFRTNTVVLFMEDNGIATPFAKANTYFASNRTPFIFQWPGVITPGSVNTSMVEEVDFFPTVLDILGLPPQAGDGQSILQILLDHTRDTGRQYVYTQIESLSSQKAFPMRCIQNRRYSYIYNMWSMDGRWYSNANEHEVMAAMEAEAATDTNIAARIELFRYRVPEELYDIVNDPGSLTNLIASAAHQGILAELRTAMRTRMVQSTDPLLPAFDARDNADAARQVFDDAYANRKLTGISKYNTWTNKYGIYGAEAEFSADPDSDGLDNLTEYSFGAIPTNGNDGAVLPMFGALETNDLQVLEYVYRRRLDAAARGLHYDLSLRNDLTAGYWKAEGYTETGTEAINSYFEWVTNSIPIAGTTNQFIRLKCIAW